MELTIRVYENGIDDNRDRHCDYCGWFVNEYERHRARRLSRRAAMEVRPDWIGRDLHLERMSAEEFSDAFIEGNPYSRPDWDPSKHSAILAYSGNSTKGISCPAINNYLRFGAVPGHVTEAELSSFVKEMNASISGFIVGKAVTLYRGMRFKPGDSYLEKLDAAFEELKERRKPVEMTERGFMSTSRSLETAKTYAAGAGQGFCRVYMSVTLEKGVAAMPLSIAHGTTAKKDDKEVLLESGRTYCIIGMSIEAKGGGLHDYYVNLLATNRRILEC